MFSKPEKSKSTFDATQLPLRSRNVEQLISADASGLPPSISFKKVSLVKKNGSREAETQYFFKKHSQNSRIIELEAYCAAICKFLAPDYVPSVRPYHDNQENLVGVTSKVTSGFKSNQADPLCENDLSIDCRAMEIEQHEIILSRLIENLLADLEKGIYSSNSYFNLDYARDSYHSFFDKIPSTYKIRDALLVFINYKGSSNHIESMSYLHTATQAREEYIKSDSTVSANPLQEIRVLRDINNAIVRLKNLYQQAESQEISLEMLEAFDQKNVDITLANEFLEQEIDGVMRTIKKQDLINYQMIKGLAVSLSTRFIFKEGDNNNSNMSKKGHIVDFDWTKANILFQFREFNLVDDTLRKPKKDSFACNQYNIKHFPDVKDAHLFYWPTKQPEFHQMIIDSISLFLSRCAKLHIENDADIHRQVAQCVLLVSKQFDKAHELNQNTLEDITGFIFNAMFQIKSVFTGKPTQQLIDNEKINMIFTRLNELFLKLTNEYDDDLIEIEKYLIQHLGNDKNTFTQQDNEMYKKLSTHPVFMFHKYKTFLKYSLTNKLLYEGFAELNVTNKPFLDSKGNTNNLIKTLVDDEMKRIHEVRRTLSGMKDFREFLEQHGRFAFDLIKDECLTVKVKYEKKSEHLMPHKKLMDALDIDAMQDAFDALCVECGVGATQQKTY